MRSLLLTITASLLAVGCLTAAPENRPLEPGSPAAFDASGINSEHRSGRILLALTFSGGGTRAAAFSYGVLQELAETPVVIEGRERRLLDEVDLISSVSGGSFTSAYYGLFGDQIFRDFEPVFLRKNVQARLAFEVLRPRNWLGRLRTDRSQRDAGQ